jgi:diguanylate cyclase (GGDEF)-like protein
MSRTPLLSAFATAVELLEARRASLLLRVNGTDKPHFTMAAAVGIHPQLAATVRVSAGQGVAGVVAERGTPLLGMVNQESFVSVPVLTQHGVEGVLNFSERDGGRPYTVKDVSRAVQAATHIAQIMEFDRLVLRDPLTGLENRRALDESLEREIARSRRLHKKFAVVFLDLDNLKQINDRSGHQNGDDLLKAMGQALEALRRPYDVAARYGGDEFVLLLTDMNEKDDLSAEDIKARLTRSFVVASREQGIELSASIGIAFWPIDGTTGKELLACADARMYEDKRSKKSS